MPNILTNKETGKIYWVKDQQLIKQWEDVQEVLRFFKRYIFYLTTFRDLEGLRIVKGLYNNGLLQYLNIIL